MTSNKPLKHSESDYPTFSKNARTGVKAWKLGKRPDNEERRKVLALYIANHLGDKEVCYHGTF